MREDLCAGDSSKKLQLFQLFGGFDDDVLRFNQRLTAKPVMFPRTHRNICALPLHLNQFPQSYPPC